ncbi:hypothetical protein L1987_82220 [Smallanthus sonchifolius]|uniref:Uncharacterized protein n=1 Tax=Smallanthus sonchifolius TaxID=185202 RepID=A0ACB8YA52_9ASTR|nr:hypothetical protein L1987_82220 [Smallanthus sonchifolius]
MADFHLPDDIICNIIARLPAKPLLRFRCVSRYWDRKLREPNFMKLRSRKGIILPLRDSFKLIDDTSNLIVERCHPYDMYPFKLTVIGSFNGVVLLAWLEYLILYNPFTGVSKLLPRPPGRYRRDARGFGYGATPDDLIIVRFRQHSDTCDLFNFREGSWTSWSMSKYNIYIRFENDVGHFVNGFFYWIAYNRSVLIAFSVKDMVLSEICPPFKIRREFCLSLLGTMDGYLCSLQPITNSRFDMWVMKEENQWSKIYSFELVELPLNHDPYYAIRILDSTRVVIWNPSSENLIIYDTSKASYKTLNISIESLNVLRVQALEYVETLVSPSDMCSSTSDYERTKYIKRGNDGKEKEMSNPYLSIK